MESNNRNNIDILLSLITTDLEIQEKIKNGIETLLPEQKEFIDKKINDLIQIDNEINSESLFTPEIKDKLMTLQKNVLLLYIKKTLPDCSDDINKILQLSNRKINIVNDILENDLDHFNKEQIGQSSYKASSNNSNISTVPKPAVSNTVSTVQKTPNSSSSTVYTSSSNISSTVSSVPKPPSSTVSNVLKPTSSTVSSSNNSNASTVTKPIPKLNINNVNSSQGTSVFKASPSPILTPQNQKKMKIIVRLMIMNY